MGKSGAMDDALASFAIAYAGRTQSDYDLLKKAKDKVNAKGTAKGNAKGNARGSTSKAA
jgi:hypothetical protein